MLLQNKTVIEFIRKGASMSKPNRRQFLTGVGISVGAGAAVLSRETDSLACNAGPATTAEGPGAVPSYGAPPAVDFRYSPRYWQTAFCFPADPYKSLIGERGELRYGYTKKCGIYCFSETVDFSLLGWEPDIVTSQELESPAVPIVRTRIDRERAFLEIITFASNRADEGRVDNVMMEIRPKTETKVHVVPLITVRTKRKPLIKEASKASVVTLDKETEPIFMAADAVLTRGEGIGPGQQMLLPVGIATGDQPARYFLRFPQAGQSFEQLEAGLAEPDRLLAEVRDYWQKWCPCHGNVAVKLPGWLGEFWTACARNIMQASEVMNGKVNFQVGPTVYRGLAVVDGNFIIEAARYLGYDAEAQQCLEAYWDRQAPSGSVNALAPQQHWKDTAIPIFTTVRQAELTQDWSYFRKLQPQILRAVAFLRSLRETAKAEGSVNGRYGLLAQGFGDGGLGTLASEFTNTLWALAGLKAGVEAADQLGLSGFDDMKQFYTELRASMVAAAKQEMRRHPEGFEYLPMLVKEDPQWKLSEWDQPRPQSGQWALSHTIFPGEVFAKDDPIVQGHIALMQACTQEDVPAETGWLMHEGVWGYNAVFVSQVYLWAGLADWARLVFVGFLNHASRLYCWREEQPTRGSLNSDYNGDMPHNWASAMCIIYLRHMFVFEDGRALRLLAGIGDYELKAGEPFQLSQTPTRFGRISVNLEPLNLEAGWRLKFERGAGPKPGRVELPATLGSRLASSSIAGAKSSHEGKVILVDPEARTWEAVWKA
jgi:hypothetical protein